MAFRAVTNLAAFIGTTAERVNQLEECAIGDEWFDETLGTWYKKSGAGTWVAISAGALTASEAIVGRLGSTAKSIATLNALPPVIAAAGDYAALDVLNESATTGHAWVLPGMARVAGYGGTITKVLMTFSVAGLIPRLRIHLFNALPTVLQNDNVAFLLDADDRSAYLGYLDMPALQTSGSSEISWSQLETAHSFVSGASTGLWAVVQTLDAFTNETAAMTATLHVTADQD